MSEPNEPTKLIIAERMSTATEQDLLTLKRDSALFFSPGEHSVRNELTVFIDETLPRGTIELVYASFEQRGELLSLTTLTNGDGAVDALAALARLHVQGRGEPLTTFEPPTDAAKGERYTSPTVYDFGRDAEARYEWGTSYGLVEPVYPETDGRPMNGLPYRCHLVSVVRKDGDDDDDCT